MFYRGDEKDPSNHSMDPVWRSPWFSRYFAEWLPGVTDIQYVRAQYDAAVAYADACVGRVLETMERRGLLDDTLLVIGSDHGEELDDHGMWFDHHGLYDTNLRVPLLLRAPGRIPQGTSISDQISLLDVTPTLLELMGLPEVVARVGMQGRSLLPLLGGKSGGTWDAIYCTECTWMRKRAWRTPQWKFIRAEEPDIYGNPRTELYDLIADPGERYNVAETRPAIAQRMGEEMDRWVNARLAATGKPDPIEEQAGALRLWQPRFIAGNPQWKKVLIRGRNALLGA
jgi:arylsulfatase A-like enzyme